jgi:hypothetical protein
MRRAVYELYIRRFNEEKMHRIDKLEKFILLKVKILELGKSDEGTFLSLPQAKDIVDNQYTALGLNNSNDAYFVKKRWTCKIEDQ